MREPGPVARYRLETGEPEQAHAWLAEFYAGHVPRLSGSRETFRMRMAGRATELVRVDEVQHTMSLDADAEPYRSLAVHRVRRGRLWVGGDGATIAAVGDEMILMDPDRPCRGGWDAIEMQSVRLDLDAASRVAEEVSGVPADRVRFGLSTPIDRMRSGHWVRTVRHVVRDVFDDDGVVANPLVRTSAFRMLVAATLSTFPNSALDELADRPSPGVGLAHPVVVRRAVGFIESAAHRDVGIAEIAEAARISVRGLQHAFRRHLDCTPLEYLRRVRMDGAHRDLRRADPTRGDSVAEVAARWGFTHPGRFAVAYRRSYGRSPRQTLHH